MSGKPSEPIAGRLVFVTCALLLALAVPGGADWTQWRGPGGTGVGSETGPLPEVWEPGAPNIRWQTEIPGEGISSPIVSNGRIFLTTAYDSPRLERMRSFCRIAAVALGALFLVAWIVGSRRRGAAVRGSRVDGWVVGLLSLFFVVAGALVTLQPERFFELGNPGRAFRVGGAIGLIGLLAAFGWFERRSRARLLGAGLVIASVALILIYMPASSRGPTPLSKSLPFVFPQLLLAIWYLLAFRKARRAGPGAGGAGGSRPVLAAILLGLTAIVYAPTTLLTGLDRVVVCLDEATGEILWERTVFTSPPEKKWPTSTYATPTAATDGELVFAYFGHGLAALDFDGRVIWRERFPDYAHNTRYGASASPILHGDALILGREQELNSPDQETWVAAWNKRTGDRLWRVVAADLHDSYTTPLLIRSSAGSQLLIPSWKAMAAHDADSGERLWKVEYTMQQIVASLARSDDLVALSGGAHGDLFIYVFRMSGEGDQMRPETLWKTTKGVSVISSPVIYDGKLFSVTVPGIMTAFDVETGEELWKKRLRGEHYASLVAGDGKVYAINTEGVATVVSAAGPEVIATNELDGTVYSSPAIADDCLLIRTTSSLLCIAGETRQANAPDAEPATDG